MHLRDRSTPRVWPYPRQPNMSAIQGVYDALRGGHRHLEPDWQLAEALEGTSGVSSSMLRPSTHRPLAPNASAGGFLP